MGEEKQVWRYYSRMQRESQNKFLEFYKRLWLHTSLWDVV